MNPAASTSIGPLASAPFHYLRRAVRNCRRSLLGEAPQNLIGPAERMRCRIGRQLPAGGLAPLIDRFCEGFRMPACRDLPMRAEVTPSLDGGLIA
jgi:hypothetical protein